MSQKWKTLCCLVVIKPSGKATMPKVIFGSFNSRRDQRGAWHFWKHILKWSDITNPPREYLTTSNSYAQNVFTVLTIPCSKNTILDAQHPQIHFSSSESDFHPTHLFETVPPFSVPQLFTHPHPLLHHIPPDEHSHHLAPGGLRR